MKIFLTAVVAAAMSVALQGQQTEYPSAAGRSPQQNATSASPSAAQGTSVSAELTKRLDTKHTKVGDPVEVRVTDTAKLPDGTALPRGTKLVGKVTDVRASSKEEKQAHLAFNLDHAVLKGGQQVPVHAALVSVTAPAPSQGSMPMMSGGDAPAGGSGSMPGGGGASAGSAPSTPAPSTTAPMATSSQPSTQGGSLEGGPDHVAVGNLTGVVLSAASGTNSAGSLDAAGQNISLESGTKLTLNLSAGA